MSPEEARSQATALVKADPRAMVMRSCWNCNRAHEHLKAADDCVICCFGCGRYYFNGVDITEDGDARA